jgi:hypothetical protein
MPRLNFTGRRRISRNHVTITVSGIGGIETFSAELQLGSYRLPESAAVIVEAYRQLELIRFDFGTVESVVSPASCRLSEFGTLDGLRFRVKVVSTEAPRGRLLAVADRILPRTEEQKSLPRVPLLAVRSQDLGREVWKLDFTDEPLLLVNPRVVPKKHLVESVEFQTLVLPEILRSILNRILLVEQIRTADDSEDWASRWLKFAESMPGVGRVPDAEDAEADLDWIDAAISSFCRWRNVDRHFAAFWLGKGPGEESTT